MAVEIEKKFLLLDNSWREGATSTLYYQGYLCSGSGATVRVRIAEEQAFLTIKGKSSGISRLEFEYPLPVEEARIILDEICLQPIIHKRRYIKEYGGFSWEIDEFYGDNEGLILAEIELEHEHQVFPRPPWLGREVTRDGRYYNASLRVNPFKKWQE